MCCRRCRVSGDALCVVCVVFLVSSCFECAGIVVLVWNPHARTSTERGGVNLGSGVQSLGLRLYC